MKLHDNWLTAPIEDENGMLHLITIRDSIQDFMASQKLKYCITIDYPFKPDNSGFPSQNDSKTIEEVALRIRPIMEKDKLAICIMDTIGDGIKRWVYACRHMPSFQNRLNECLADLPKMPLVFDAVEDPSWGDYKEVLSMVVEANKDLE